MTGHLPARTEVASFGQQGTPLSMTPTPALAFALGYACARPQHADSFGPFCALVEELASLERAHNDGARRNAYVEIIEALPPDLAQAVTVLYAHQRGQRWSATGQPGAHGRGPDVGPQTGAERHADDSRLR